MTYVIASTCIKDDSCIEVRPVDCIHPMPGGARLRRRGAALPSSTTSSALVRRAISLEDPSVLQRAYDDSAGVTAEFNLNVLRVIMRELGANFASSLSRPARCRPPPNFCAQSRLSVPKLPT